MTDPTAKSPLAYKTISEVAEQIGVPQHVLRFWETRFPSLRPLKRGGNRRYYRPEDVALVSQINTLLYSEGYTIKGVQKLLAGGAAARPAAAAAAPAPAADDAAPAPITASLTAIRDRLAAALADFENRARPRAMPSQPNDQPWARASDA